MQRSGNCISFDLNKILIARTNGNELHPEFLLILFKGLFKILHLHRSFMKQTLKQMKLINN